MKIGVDLPDYRSFTRGIADDLSRFATGAMRETTLSTVLGLRRDTVQAGLSQRFANTWRDRVYPERRDSISPTGRIWSNAPAIADSFSRGSTIYPLAGRRFLAIPTEAVPRARRRISFDGQTRSGRMTPEEVEHAFNADLFFRRVRNGNVLAFLKAVQSRNRRGFKPATRGRLKQGREAKPVLMFVLVPQVKMPHLYDLDRTVEGWANRYVMALGARMEG